MLGTRRASIQLLKQPSPELIIPEVPETIESKISEITITEEQETEEPIIKSNVVCKLFNNDSFEENETMLANCSINETILASSLIMTAKKEDTTLKQLLSNIEILLKKNSENMEKNLQERKILVEMKQDVTEKLQKLS